MRAKCGDWLIVETSTVDKIARRGRIESVATDDGKPPFRVRWANDDHVSLVFPGPDAHVVTDSELAELERAGRFGGA